MVNQIEITRKQIHKLSALIVHTETVVGVPDDIQLSTLNRETILRVDFAVDKSPYVALIDKEGKRVDGE